MSDEKQGVRPDETTPHLVSTDAVGGDEGAQPNVTIPQVIYSGTGGGAGEFRRWRPYRNAHQVRIELSDEALDIFRHIVDTTAESPEDIVRKAFAMYHIALEARRQGKAVGVATSADSLETEFVGL